METDIFFFEQDVGLDEFQGVRMRKSEQFGRKKPVYLKSSVSHLSKVMLLCPQPVHCSFKSNRRKMSRKDNTRSHMEPNNSDLVKRSKAIILSHT